MSEKKKALVAMSGGVDSAMAALLTKEAGFDVTGVTMQLLPDAALHVTNASGCCTAEDIADARRAADAVGIPHRLVDMTDGFEKEVMVPFVRAYESGRTPNPCVECNRRLKFGRLFDLAREEGFDAVVTGHYARVVYDAARGRYLLKKALDPTKDQSYVLYALTQAQLARIRFPLGDYRKSDIRDAAERFGLPNARKKDSQDICFVRDGDYVSFIENYTKKTYPPGDFVTRDGTVLGHHKGLIRYTIGQRKGLGLVCEEPLYVLAVAPEENRVILGRNEDLFTRELDAYRVNLIDGETLAAPRRVLAKIRYRQPEQPATVTQTGRDTWHIVFDTPQRAVTPGQTVVLYDGDTVVGGGIIA